MILSRFYIGVFELQLVAKLDVKAYDELFTVGKALCPYQKNISSLEPQNPYNILRVSLFLWLTAFRIHSLGNTKSVNKPDESNNALFQTNPFLKSHLLLIFRD